MLTARKAPRTRVATLLAGVVVATVAGVVAPAPVAAAPPATAPPATAADALERAEQAAQKLTGLDEQVHRAELIVRKQRVQARAAAQTAAKAQAEVAAFEPQLRAIAHSGYTARSQSRVAAFLTSDSATDLVQQMATLDMIAKHTAAVISQAAAAQTKALAAKATADTAAKKSTAGLAELKSQKAEVQRQVDRYEATFARLTAREQARVTAAIAGPTLAAPSAAAIDVDPGSAVAGAIRTALAQVGKPYVWGSSGPNGFDCSGLTSFAYAAAGVPLPHSSGAQAGYGRSVSRAELRPGDLVFFYSPISHVGLYIGNGMMVHARTFGQPVAVTSVDQAGYVQAQRLVG